MEAARAPRGVIFGVRACASTSIVPLTCCEVPLRLVDGGSWMDGGLPSSRPAPLPRGGSCRVDRNRSSRAVPGERRTSWAVGGQHACVDCCSFTCPSTSGTDAGRTSRDLR